MAAGEQHAARRYEEALEPLWGEARVMAHFAAGTPAEAGGARVVRLRRR